MTACAFVHPPGLPTVISDLIIGPAIGRTINPSNIGIAVHPFQGPRATLARKTVCLGSPPIIFGFAGDVKAIKQVVAGLIPEIASLSPERKSRQIGDQINRYISQTRLQVSAVGFACSRPEEDINVLFGFENNRFQTYLFNECGATGTGSEWLKSRILYADRLMSESGMGARNPLDNLIGLLGYVNSFACFEATLKNYDPSFGGYFVRPEQPPYH